MRASTFRRLRPFAQAGGAGLAAITEQRKDFQATGEVWRSDSMVFLWIMFVWYHLYDDLDHVLRDSWLLDIFCCWTMMLEMFCAALRSLIQHMQDLLDQWDRIDSSWKTFKASRKLNELTTLSIDLEVGTPFCGKLERNNLKSRCLDVSQADKQNI